MTILPTPPLRKTGEGIKKYQKQQKLLIKYRKRIKKLKAKILRQRYFILLSRMERLEIAYRRHPSKPLEAALRRLHARLRACGMTPHA